MPFHLWRGITVCVRFQLPIPFSLLTHRRESLTIKGAKDAEFFYSILPDFWGEAGPHTSAGQVQMNERIPATAMSLPVIPLFARWLNSRSLWHALQGNVV